MIPRIVRCTAIVTAGVFIALSLSAASASAQWQRRPQTTGFAASWAYSGGENGYRLELARQNFVVSAGLFDTDGYKGRGNGDIYALELGISPETFMPGYEGMPFVLGAGGYRFSPDDPEQDEDDSFNIWLGTGDFDHSRKGLFYQYRYIFGGPMEGSQGVIGWAF